MARRLRTPGRVAHGLLVNDCRVSLTLAAPAAGYELLEWQDELDLGWMGTEAGFVPDGYFKVRRPTPAGAKTAAFFLEVERTARSGSAISYRLSHYQDYYRGGKYEAGFGTRVLRVLMIIAINETERPTRILAAMVKRVAALGATFFRFTTLAEF